jgi:tRNA A37 methylthiotransferase MiaB
MSKAYRQQLVGKTVEVLFEEPEGEYFAGHTPNYLKVYYKGDGLHNQLRAVKITNLFRDGLLAEDN